MQVAWLRDTDSRKELPRAFARYLIGTEVLERGQTQDSVIALVARYRDEFMNSLRRDGRLEKKLYELIVLVVVRHWGAQYAWAQHQSHAVSAGI